MPVNIREGSTDEALTLFARVPEFHEDPTQPFPDSDAVTIRIRNEVHVVLLAEIEGQLAGAMIGYDKFHDGSAYCWLAGVDADLRRNGALTKLMEAFEEWSKDQGFNSISITTRNSRRSMLAFLIRHNFLLTEVEESPKGILQNRIHFIKPLDANS